MRNKGLAIYDENIWMAEKFADYLRRQKDSPFIVKIYTDLQCYLSDEHKNDLLLVGMGVMGMEIETSECERIILWEEGEVPKEYASYPMIYRYQSAKIMYRELMKIYMDREDVVLKNISGKEQNGELVGIYSPGGSIKTTALSILMAKEIEGEKQVLWFSMDEFKLQEEIEGVRIKEGVSELLYYLKQKTSNLGMKIVAFTEKIGKIDCLGYAACVYELREITIEEWKELFEILKIESGYETIVVDIGPLPQDIEFFELFDKLYIPVVSKGSVELQHFYELLDQLNVEGIKEKMEEIVIGQEY